MKSFAPSVQIFKVFLSFFLPVVLIFILSIVFGTLHSISPTRFSDIKRYIVISVVSSIFLLHPNITKQTLSLFECVSIEEDDFRMRVHTDYKCFSGDHITWIMVVGLPNIIIWIVGAPSVAFYILFKNKENLESQFIKGYYLILYQGLRHKVYYWEFVNTMRKIMILAVNAILSMLPISYRIGACIIMLLFIVRFQMYVSPYKTKINNILELRAMVASLVIIYSGIIFEEGSSSRYPGFETLALLLIMLYNIIFVMQWGYYFLSSFNSKYEFVKTFLKLYGNILCIKQKNGDQDAERDDQDAERDDKVIHTILSTKRSRKRRR